ncbi:type I-F CRISPR-associated helicase Cas3 [Marinobacterium nitratireducens]|uniref:Type I-F CRISPR-associated helicase Cas3 n=1 Tax=Marinobacterium nitratireducens TaxID=518897 RepID=A0A917ZDX9_9GAMM|nr:type I-F CRISPR-associated helicase Cas3f [Marinobacterium nitratireducens]GGO80064.1 type I-F CRISPR-associated helicase Cas3 [Marinobacterium nitratireducens]
MIVVLISQCSKRALPETRRILDQFAERSGDRTWICSVTLEGLNTLRKLLRKSARRNTAVACHRVRGTSRVELEWVVGNPRRFDFNGKTPTNRTGRNVLREQSESQWSTAESIAVLAGIAGLFHDFGKANQLFQKKLSEGALRTEPLRHEWVSLLLFRAFVMGGASTAVSDADWLQRLAEILPEMDTLLMEEMSACQQDLNRAKSNPLVGLPPLARTVGWLVLSHHRLPRFDSRYGSQIGVEEPRLEALEPSYRLLTPSWNSPQIINRDWTTQDWQDLFTLKDGSPIASTSWCRKAREIARRALQHRALLDRDWLLEDDFTSHLARLSLMLADHSYSAGSARTHWWDDGYRVYANTGFDDRRERVLKQRLDEHNVGVGQSALLLARRLPQLSQTLPAISRHRALRQRTQVADFRWQNKAFEMAQGLAERSQQCGFFGINLASTGKGKTFANARIMYGLSDERRGCRFSVALGLRTLTLQTGDALRARLRLDNDELAVLIGSQAVKELHELRNGERQTHDKTGGSGSESAEALVDESLHITFEGSLSDGPLSRWLGKDHKVNQLVSAPVLVSTIDHLIPATEGVRGGRQIAPMLRLLTSDLVLDEPDDFDVADLPALCRLVNWAGLLGSRVLLSSATLPPALVSALFDAYRVGRTQYNRVCRAGSREQSICCAWFDEFESYFSDIGDLKGFANLHQEFVGRRITKLNQQLPIQLAELITVEPYDKSHEGVVRGIVEAVATGVIRLHQLHHQTDPVTGKRVSLGLVRMANINPLVAVARALATSPLPEDSRLHLCVYHSQYPMLVRSHIEARLDTALDRHNVEALWQVAEIRQALDQHPEQDHVFVVLGSPVCEVGRDHDYDWAIAEPSSIRSLIQLAGRLQRHRKQQPEQPNLLIMSRNYRALHGHEYAYCRPGFEVEIQGSKQPLKLESKDLNDVLKLEQFARISAAPRIQESKNLRPTTSLVDLEHVHLRFALEGHPVFKLKVGVPAGLWWCHDPRFPLSWNGEMQRRTPFRASVQEERFLLHQEDEVEPPVFFEVNDKGLLGKAERRFQRVEIEANSQVSTWIEQEPGSLFALYADALDLTVDQVSQRHGELRLRKKEERWCYHPWFGVFELPKG